MASGNGGPHDKPGVFRLVPLMGDVASQEVAFNQAEDDGYEFQGLNNEIAVFYKKT